MPRLLEEDVATERIGEETHEMKLPTDGVTDVFALRRCRHSDETRKFHFSHRLSPERSMCYADRLQYCRRA